MSDSWRSTTIETLEGLLKVMHVSDFSTKQEAEAVTLAIGELKEPTCCMCGEAIKHSHCNEDST